MEREGLKKKKKVEFSTKGGEEGGSTRPDFPLRIKINKQGLRQTRKLRQCTN